MLTLLTFLV